MGFRGPYQFILSDGKGGRDTWSELCGASYSITHKLWGNHTKYMGKINLYDEIVTNAVVMNCVFIILDV